MKPTDISEARRARRNTRRERISHYIDYDHDDHSTIHASVSALTRLLPALTGSARLIITAKLEAFRNDGRIYKSSSDQLSISLDKAGGEAVRMAALDEHWSVYPHRPGEPVYPYDPDFTGCEMCKAAAVYVVERWVGEDGNQLERKEVPCPACQGERVTRRMTLEAWEQFCESAHDLEEYYSLDWGVVQSWDSLVSRVSRETEITIEVPAEFNDFIQAMIDDAKSEAEAARWA